MNGIALQLSASAIALGLMGSAVGVHYFQVRESVVAQGEEELYDEIAFASYEPARQSGTFGSENPALAGVAELRVEKSEKEVQLELLQQMVFKLEQLNDENRSLRNETVQLQEQVAETNRDLSQLQFRVDTHSESFRPLRVSEDSTFQKAVPVPSVLPPKDW